MRPLVKTICLFLFICINLNAEDFDELVMDEDALDENSLIYEAPPLIFEVPAFDPRYFETVFPDLTWDQRLMAQSSEGLRNFFRKDEPPAFVPNTDLEIDLLSSVMKINPSHIIEALVLVTDYEREFDLLDIYNALGRIEKIKDQTIFFNGNDYYVFTESTRIESSQNKNAIPDPLPTDYIPISETMYIRLNEVNFGDIFIRGNISAGLYGMNYSMTNFEAVRYYIPVIRAEGFATIIYLEPVKEGLLIYSVTGFFLPEFFGSMANLTPHINRMIDVFLDWIIEGLREQENIIVETDAEP